MVKKKKKHSKGRKHLSFEKQMDKLGNDLDRSFNKIGDNIDKGATRAADKFSKM